MFKLEGPRDERGISEVLGATIVIAMVIAVGSVFYVNYVQSSIHSTEADFMDEVRGTFIDLQSAIYAMGVGQYKLVSIPMNPSFPPLVPSSGEVGTVWVDPGYAYFLQTESVQNLTTESIVGDENGLKIDNDGKYLEVNQVIFNENFANSLSWDGPHVVPPNDDGTAGFDSTVSHTYDTTGSIVVFASTGGLIPDPCYENAYWDRDLDNSLENYPNVTLQAWFGKCRSGGGLAPDVYESWRIDVENGEPPSWKTSVIFYENTVLGDYGRYYWFQKNTLPNPIKNKVEKIRVYMYAMADAWLLGEASAYAWTDDITMWAGPPFLDNIIIESGQIPRTQNIVSVEVTIGFWSMDYGSMENLYIFENNGTDNWLIGNLKLRTLKSENVKASYAYLPDNKKYWHIVLDIENNPDNYIDKNGRIWLNMVGENKITPFRLVFDYLNFKVNYENQYREGSFQGYYGGSGKLEFNMKNYSYPNQTYIYDDGAVIVAQGDSSTMVSEPPLTSGDSPPTGSAFVDVEKGTGDNIVVTVNHFVLKGSPASISKGGYSSVVVSVLTDKYTWFTQDNDNVYITIPYSSDTANAWTNYLSTLAYYLNSNSDFNSKTDFRTRYLATANGLTLAITRTDNDNNRRIHYSETVTEIGFSLA